MNQTEKIVDRSRKRLFPEPGRVFHRTGRPLVQTARHSREAGAPLHYTPQAPFRSVTPRPPAKSHGSHQSLPVRFQTLPVRSTTLSVRSTTSSVRSISTEPGNKKKRYQDLTKPNPKVNRTEPQCEPIVNLSIISLNWTDCTFSRTNTLRSR